MNIHRSLAKTSKEGVTWSQSGGRPGEAERLGGLPLSLRCPTAGLKEAVRELSKWMDAGGRA